MIDLFNYPHIIICFQFILKYSFICFSYKMERFDITISFCYPLYRVDHDVLVYVLLYRYEIKLLKCPSGVSTDTSAIWIALLSLPKSQCLQFLTQDVTIMVIVIIHNPHHIKTTSVQVQA